MSCSICIEPFNKYSCIAVKCDFCDFTACRSCNQKYILEQRQQAHCMNCKHEWNREILINKFTKKFVNAEYRKHRENILFDNERSLLPATQNVVTQIIERQKIQQKILELEKQLQQLRTSLYINSTQTNVQRSVFIKKCTNGDCRGFLSTQWKCSICDYWTCPECHEVKGTSRDSSHHCKTEDIETAKMISKETRGCPKCGVPIYKILGCDQMWCTQCHTAFSWQTGRIETSTLHNPHYYEWLRKNGKMERNPADIQCGREINNEFSLSILNDKIFYICRKIIHIRIVELPRFNGNAINNNEDIRIKYLMKEIDEPTFKTRIQRREKEFEKKREVANIIGMYIVSATDIIYRFTANKETAPKQYLTELENLRLYTNECFEKMCRFYDCKGFKLTKDLSLIRTEINLIMVDTK